MSNILNKFRKDKKDYKTLYETELNNRKMYEKRYREIEKTYREYQKESGIADMRKKMMELADELSFVKEDRAKLYVQLEDIRNELEMEKKKNNG